MNVTKPYSRNNNIKWATKYLCGKNDKRKQKKNEKKWKKKNEIYLNMEREKWNLFMIQ